MLKELMHIILIHLPNNKISSVGNMRTNGQTFKKPTCAEWKPIIWRTTIDNPKPSTTSFRPGESRFELVLAPLLPAVDQAIISSECADMGFSTVYGKVPITKIKPPGVAKPDQATTRRDG
jgi:hypothetical protein